MPRAPVFWGEPPGLLANLLCPAGAAWDSAARLRHALSGEYRAPIPVVCVGNLVAGGSGKTPVTLALASQLTLRGVAAHIVTRGYGGRLGGPVQVDPACHDAAAVGDEAILHARRAPAWVARDRAAGIRAAAAAGARMILLDDGLQNPTIAKDLALVVVDAAYGFGNARVIPAGPLRENLARGLARAHAVVLLGAGAASEPRKLIAFGGLPVIHAIVAPLGGERLAGARLLAFAGIGRPDKFFATLRSLDADLVGTRAFPDHHSFSTKEIDHLIRDANRAQARLVTTAKDIVRLPPARRRSIEVLEIEIQWRDPPALDELMRPLVLSAGHPASTSA
jgi:tetraacyldisaccharide 4'-kinase